MVLQVIGSNVVIYCLSCSTILGSFMGHKDVVLIVVLSGVDLREVMHNDDVSIVGALSKAVHVLHEASSLFMCQLSMFLQLLSFLLFFFSILS